jgi:hypothetical protein
MTGIALAQKFHLWLEDCKHENTYALFSSGLLTDMALVFDPPERPQPVEKNRIVFSYKTEAKWPNRGAQLVRREQGDGTVPRTSAAALFPNKTDAASTIPENVFEASPNQVAVQEVEHAKAFDDATTQTEVLRLVERILLGG